MGKVIGITSEYVVKVNIQLVSGGNQKTHLLGLGRGLLDGRGLLGRLLGYSFAGHCSCFCVSSGWEEKRNKRERGHASVICRLLFDIGGRDRREEDVGRKTDNI